MPSDEFASNPGSTTIPRPSAAADQTHRRVDPPVVGDANQADRKLVALVQQRGVVLRFVVEERLRSVAPLVRERVDLQCSPNPVCPDAHANP